MVLAAMKGELSIFHTLHIKANSCHKNSMACLAWGVMSASCTFCIDRPKFIVQCQRNGPAFDFFPENGMTRSCLWLMQNYRYSKKTRLFLSLLLEILGRGGWLGITNVWALYHLYIAPFAPSCPLPPFCSGADGNGSLRPCSQDSSPRALGNCQLTLQLGLPAEPRAIHVRLQAELAQWFLMLEKKTQMKRHGTNLNFILEVDIDMQHASKQITGT